MAVGSLALGAGWPGGATAGTFVDTFTPGLDSNYWSVIQSTPNFYSVIATAGSVQLAKNSAPNPGGVQYVFVRVNLTALGGSITNDFSAQVSFSGAVVPGPGLDQVELHSYYQDGSIFYTVYDRVVGYLNAHVWDGGSVLGVNSVAGSAGTFRITRVGSTVTGYFNDTPLASVGRGSPLTAVDFVLQNNAGSDDAISVTFDNFSLSGPDVSDQSPAQSWTTNNLPPGLISWWNADGNTLDVKGLNPASSSGQTYTPGRFGQAFHFNGVNQSVTAPGSASLDQWTQFTLEAWMKLDQTADPINDAPGRMVINRVGRADDQVNYNQGYQFGFWNNARNLVLAFNTNGQAWPGIYTEAVLPAPMPTNVWLHYAATYDHSAVILYLNGVPLKTNVIGAATIAHSTSSFRIGMDDNGNCPFPGSIDDVRVYNRALTAAEIASLYAGPDLPVTAGLKLHYDAGEVNAGSNPAEGAAVTTWRDLSGLGLDATPLFGVAPVYRTNALNGRAGVDFRGSGSDALATAFSGQLNFTNCTIFMVANGAGSPTHVSISAPCVTQEFILGDKAIYHHSSPYHWVNRGHQNSPSGYYLQAGLFGTTSNELANCINGIFSTNRLVFSWEIGQQSPVADYARVNRQAILGWRNTDATCNAPIADENLNGVICEVLVYDRQLSAPEVDALNFFLANKYGLAVTPLPPVLTAVALASGTVALAWPSTLGRQYQLQSAPSLPDASWTNEGGPLPGTGGVLSISPPSSVVTQKFFRLQVNE